MHFATRASGGFLIAPASPRIRPIITGIAKIGEHKGLRRPQHSNQPLLPLRDDDTDNLGDAGPAVLSVDATQVFPTLTDNMTPFRHLFLFVLLLLVLPPVPLVKPPMTCPLEPARHPSVEAQPPLKAALRWLEIVFSPAFCFHGCGRSCEAHDPSAARWRP